MFVLLVVASSAAGYYAIPRAKKQLPSGLVAEPAVVRVGERAQGELVKVQFTLTNHYPGPVEIHSVITGCSCLVPTVTRKHIAPGQDTTISLDWYTGTKRGSASESVWVFHSIPGADPKVVGRMQLGVEGEVIPDVRFDPERVRFTAGTPATTRVTLSASRMPSFTVREIYANSPALSAKFLTAESAVEITYTPKGQLDTGSQLHVSVATDSQREPTLRIPVVTSP